MGGGIGKIVTLMIALLVLAAASAATVPQPPQLIYKSLPPLDYPVAAFMAGATGLVTVSFAVTIKGRVSGCNVERTSTKAVLDQSSCRMVKRFRYTPALDAQNKPVEQRIQQSFKYCLQPGCLPDLGGPGTIIIVGQPR